MATEDDLIIARKKHAAELAAGGTVAYPAAYDSDEARRHEVLTIANDEARRANLPTEDELSESADHFPLYGRVMAKRGPFLVIATPYGTAQALVRPERLPEADATQFSVVDLADHVAVSGPLMRTRTGALAVAARAYRHLSKAQLPPPAKWHGLTDVEKRYRERYVDLFANPDVASVFRARSLIVRKLRSFLEGAGFLEVETPILQPLRGGATAKPFRTHHNTLDIDMYLRVAPELYLKRLLVGGFDRVFELGRTFRNEGISTRHNPEFTLLEFYMAYATYQDLMALSEALVAEVDQALLASFPAFAEGRTFDLTPPWPRVSMRQAIVQAAVRSGHDNVPATPWAEVLTAATVDDAALLEAAVSGMLANVSHEDRKVLGKCQSYGERIASLFELVAEPALPHLYRSADGKRSVPVFITEFPIEVSPLARRGDKDPQFADRFELFLEGRELANAFTELNDPDDQAQRFRGQLENRARGDEEAMDFDADYIRALQHGMPPAAGFGLGVDRLVMFLCSQSSIRDVLLFPLLKPEAQ